MTANVYTLPPLGFEPLAEDERLLAGERYLVWDSRLPKSLEMLRATEDQHYLVGQREYLYFLRVSELLRFLAPVEGAGRFRPKLTMLVKTVNDTDPVPGWGDNSKDWIRLLGDSFLRQGHYNTQLEVLALSPQIDVRGMDTRGVYTSESPTAPVRK